MRLTRLVMAYLDEVLAFRLGDQWLKLWCREGVYQPSLGHHKQKDLRAGKNGELVRLDGRVVSTC